MCQIWLPSDGRVEKKGGTDRQTDRQTDKGILQLYKVDTSVSGQNNLLLSNDGLIYLK